MDDEKILIIRCGMPKDHNHDKEVAYRASMSTGYRLVSTEQGRDGRALLFIYERVNTHKDKE